MVSGGPHECPDCSEKYAFDELNKVNKRYGGVTKMVVECPECDIAVPVDR